ncbi:MAG: DUF1156 domain-containing protein, partial [Chloroflexi bacterium]|nr:DUF1156 domain-containing protein [Chloroflexota bacterium]
MPPRIIEVDFPLRRVSEESVREKNIRHGHVSTLHVWWARRPLAASRTTALAALLPDDPRRRDDFLHLLGDIAPWEAVTQSDDVLQDSPIQRARDLIRDTFGGIPPRVLDCFAGGGSIALEALRLGCETHALDYNPVAVTILRAVLEYPQKFGKTLVQSESGSPGSLGFITERTLNPLLESVKRWGSWVLEEARKELGDFYPKDPDGSIPVGYIWARTLPCQNPSCGVEIPLMRHFWLARKEKKQVTLRPRLNPLAGRVDFDVVVTDGRQMDFDPEEGTVSHAHVRCPMCSGTMDNKATRHLFHQGKSGQRLVAVVLHHPGHTGKIYRLPTQRDFELYQLSGVALERKRRILWGIWGMDPVPNEPLIYDPRNIWLTPFFPKEEQILGSLFNTRQKLALITFADKIRQTYPLVIAEGTDPEFAKAVLTYLALALDRLADFGSTLCVLNVTGGRGVFHTFARQALPMVWDYAESNPFNPEGAGWLTACEKNEKWIKAAASVAVSNVPVVTVTHGSATGLPWPDNYFDAVLTDPPYYDNVNYSALSDFFYVWLKRTLGDGGMDLFSTPLTPKSEEIVQDPDRHGGRQEAQAFFELSLTQAFREIQRVIKPDGIAVIIFAHKTTEAWESIINALLKAGLYMTASWPIHTEMRARLNAQETASLASSIYMVCRKRTATEIGEYRTVRRQIEALVHRKLVQFWDGGIRGGDFFMSAIGPAVEIFGKYTQVERLSGEPVTVGELLEYVRTVVSEFALERILRSAQLGGVDMPTRFYLLYRWTYNHARVPFDEANRLALAVGVELVTLWDPGGLV